MAVAAFHAQVLLPLPVNHQYQRRPIHPRRAQLAAHLYHQDVGDAVAEHGGFGIVAAEGDGGGFDADFQVVFFVCHGVECVVGECPEYVGEK